LKAAYFNKLPKSRFTIGVFVPILRHVHF